MSLFEGYTRDDYDGVWRLWKFGSLGLFAVFVAAMIDCARTLRRIETGRAKTSIEVAVEEAVAERDAHWMEIA